jgi:hypothetical protein
VITFENTLEGQVGQNPTNTSLAATGDPVTVADGDKATYADLYTVHDRSVIKIATGEHRYSTTRLGITLPSVGWSVRWYVWFPAISTGNGERRWLARFGDLGLVAHQTSAGNMHLRFSPLDISAAETSGTASGSAQSVGQWLRVEINYMSANNPVARIYSGHAEGSYRQIDFTGINLSGTFNFTGFRFRRRTTLRWGDTGSAVQELQEELISLGYNLGSAGADGIFGDATYYAVVDFQETHDLSPVDGEAGSETRAAIDYARGLTFPNLFVSHVAVSDTAWVGPAEAPPPPLPDPDIYPWSIGMSI